MTEDADDTAVMALELFRHGILGLHEVRRIVCTRLIPFRLPFIHGPAPPWSRPGVFLTWLQNGVDVNPVDCCVNVNVVALMAYAGLTHLPGYHETCEMILDGIRWAGRSWQRARALVPYYPSPGELFCALRHAVQCGAGDLQSGLDELRQFQPTDEIDSNIDPSLDRPLFGSSNGNIVWTSSVLALARYVGETMSSS
jgi:hypothetical protein